MEENTTPKNKVFIYLLAGFFLLFVATQLFLISKNQKNKPQPNSTEDKEVLDISPTVLPIVTSGTMTLSSKSDRYSIESGNITVSLTSDSIEKNIVGYDVVLEYDPLSFDFVSATSKLSDFKIYSYKRSGYLVLTGVKDLGSQLKTTFKETDIADLVFQPKNTGKYVFELKQVIDNDKTDLITDNTEVLNPSLNKLSVEVY